MTEQFAECPPWCLSRDEAPHLTGDDDHRSHLGLRRFHLGHDYDYYPDNAPGACIRWGGDEFAGLGMRMFVDIYSLDGHRFSPQEVREVARGIMEAADAAEVAGPSSPHGYTEEGERTPPPVKRPAWSVRLKYWLRDVHQRKRDLHRDSKLRRRFGACPSWCRFRHSANHSMHERDRVLWEDKAKLYHVGYENMSLVDGHGSWVRWCGEDSTDGNMELFVTFDDAGEWCYAPVEARQVARALLEAADGVEAIAIGTPDAYCRTA